MTKTASQRLLRIQARTLSVFCALLVLPLACCGTNCRSNKNEPAPWSDLGSWNQHDSRTTFEQKNFPYGNNRDSYLNSPQTRRNATHTDFPNTNFIQAVTNDSYPTTLFALLDMASKSIHVTQFECNDDYLVDKVIAGLIAAHNRGVEVKVLLENELPENKERVAQLKSAGVTAKLDSPARYTHAKLFIIDGTFVLVGSTNLSAMSMKYNNETNVLVRSKTIAEFFEYYFEQVWIHPSEPANIAPVSDTSVGVVSTLRDGLYFEAVFPRIQEAKKRIHLLIYGYHLNPQYPDSELYKLADAMVSAHERGVDVKVVLERSDFDPDLNKINEYTAAYLRSKGIDVRFDLPDQISHAKLLIVDSEAIVGSNNWGYGGFHLYHELGVITNDAQTVVYFEKYFQSLWAKSTQ